MKTLHLANALEQSWPPERTEELGGCRIRSAPGAGSRVNSTLPVAGEIDTDLVRARLAALSQNEIWQIWPDAPKPRIVGGEYFDETSFLAARWSEVDVPSAQHHQTLQSTKFDDVFQSWEPALPEPRRQIMARASSPKVALAIPGQARCFVSIANRIGFIHALETHPDARRSGAALALVFEARRFAKEKGADSLAACALVVNHAAQNLFKRCGLKPVSTYRYWRPV